MEMQHPLRRKWVEEVSRMNREINESEEKRSWP